MPPETATSPSTLALLSLPPHAKLAQAQTRGASCVWCGIRLDTATAVDLGERRHDRYAYSTFPRACAGCVGTAADRALRAHAGLCEQCVDDGARCEIATALRQLIEASR
ncbi:hypothetical protein IAG44_30910 [Streptomyces roseirectus]|uniref:Uncharacterized protein n=1 Tax=Streptomyces roseirectus TaxID=2768066 RepID=A0A7H0IKV7_9ACTN|nr:hypothetical protein [Streptomyces roseirectus]QNP73423.1 hypothetical protein IAG44_30910 [Streptomyces roseirectus]